ncbi:hypothetical protein BPTFM16_02733 [Altererythrobacter insulae]|nr:hypothetical protein BPTFM16_02733 [Altererythrobacter insulae]
MVERPVAVMFDWLLVLLLLSEICGNSSIKISANEPKPVSSIASLSIVANGVATVKLSRRKRDPVTVIFSSAVDFFTFLAGVICVTDFAIAFSASAANVVGAKAIALPANAVYIAA